MTDGVRLREKKIVPGHCECVRETRWEIIHHLDRTAHSGADVVHLTDTYSLFLGLFLVWMYKYRAAST